MRSRKTDRRTLSLGAFRREFRVSLQICLVGGNCGSLTRFEWRPAARLAQPVNSDAGNAVSVFCAHYQCLSNQFALRGELLSYGVDRSLREHLCQNKRFSQNGLEH